MKELLEQIVEQLKGRDEGFDNPLWDNPLWSVLTALRGPDDDRGDIKEATTAIIRAKVGIPVNNNTSGCLVNGDSRARVTLRKSLSRGDHFAGHAKAAFLALGLAWDEVNEVEVIYE